MTDPGHTATDAKLKELEKRLRETYKQAADNATQKFNDFMVAFDRKDKKHKADVKSGKWTQAQYDTWRKNQLLVSDQISEMRDTIAEDFANVDKIAVGMMQDNQLDVYAINHNYGTFQIEKDAHIDTSYSLYDKDTVKLLMRDQPDLLPRPSKKKQTEINASNLKWNKQKLTSAFTASIINGDSIPKMANSISSVAAMNMRAAIRNARTMTTGAESAGRIDSYKRAQEMGINILQQWVATLDERTRSSHRMLDGEKIKIGAKFSNGCRFPGDPEGKAAEVYNCRCRTVAVVEGIDPMIFDKTDTLRRKTGKADITYEEWKGKREVVQPPESWTNTFSSSLRYNKKPLSEASSYGDVKTAIQHVSNKEAQNFMDTIAQKADDPNAGIVENFDRRAKYWSDYKAGRVKDPDLDNIFAKFANKGTAEPVKEKIKTVVRKKPKESPAKDVLGGFKKITTSHSVADDVRATNPGYKSKVSEWTRNCQRCVNAFEARCRGYDVTASKRILNGDDPLAYMTNTGWPSVYKDGFKSLIHIMGKSGSEQMDAVVKQMKSFGEGSRAIVRVQWARGGGHVFTVCNEKGRVKFYDPQSGSVYSIDSYFYRCKLDQTYLLRTDDKEFTDRIKDCIQ